VRDGVEWGWVEERGEEREGKGREEKEKERGRGRVEKGKR